MKIPMENRVRIFAGIQNLKDTDTWGDVKRLVNHIYDYPLRVGDYRVLFNLKEDADGIDIGDISVEEIKKRDDHTYKRRSNMASEVQFIKDNGKLAWAVIPYAIYEEMERRLAIAKAQEEVSYPIDVAEMHAIKGYSLIKAWRIHLHKTQKELADALNITQGAFSQIEKSEHNQAETIERIAKVLGILPEQLIL